MLESPDAPTLDGRTLIRSPSNEGSINIGHDKLMSNLRTNIKRHLPQVYPYDVSDAQCVIVCGGPSVRHSVEAITQHYEQGHCIVAVNGTYKRLQENGIIPTVFIMLDGRPENIEFISHPIMTCRHLIATQCDPSIFEALADYSVTMWHGGSCEEEQKLLHEYYLGRFFMVSGGTTVTIKALSLMRLLGFQFYDIYGFDSCWEGELHHGFAQPMNDKDKLAKVDCAGRTYMCSPWHVRQAKDFLNNIRQRGHLYKMRVHGPGLIAHLLKTGAEMQISEGS